MHAQLSHGSQGLTYWPECNIATFALLLNFPWEFLQVPFYGGMPTAEHWQGVKSCTQATIGDAVIMLVAYWCVAAFAGRYWLLRPKIVHVISPVAVGVGITILIEVGRLWGLGARLVLLGANVHGVRRRHHTCVAVNRLSAVDHLVLQTANGSRLTAIARLNHMGWAWHFPSWPG